MLLKTATMALCLAVAVQATEADERVGRDKYRALRGGNGRGGRSRSGGRSHSSGRSRSHSRSPSVSPAKLRCEEGWLGLNLVDDSPSTAFSNVDEDEDGLLDRDEFKSLFMDYDAIDGEERKHWQVDQCRNTFDLNGDRKIDNYEFNRLLQPTVEFRCAHAIFQSANGSNTYGWAQILEPTSGPYAGYAQITASIRDFPSGDDRTRQDLGNSVDTNANTGAHGFHIHKFDRLGNDCSDTDRHYNPPIPENDEDRADTWFIGELQSSALVVLEDDASPGDSTNRADYFAWDPLVSIDPDYEFNVLDRSFVVHDNDCDDATCDSLKKTRIACGAIREGCYPQDW